MVRRLRDGNRAVLLLVAAISGGFWTGLSAHRLDEFLQAARIGLESERVNVELSLTPGMSVADTVIHDIDRDGDGSLSVEEQHAYALRVLRNIELNIDGGSLATHLVEANFPDLRIVRNGEGTIVLRSSTVVPPFAAGSHHLFFRNTNDPSSGVYLANALVPDSDRVAVTAQKRDGSQRELTIDFVARAAPAISLREWVLIDVLGATSLCALFARRARRE